MVEQDNLGVRVLEQMSKQPALARTLRKKDSAVRELWRCATKKGKKYKQAAEKYLETYAAYIHYNKPRQLITDLDKIVNGVAAIHGLPEAFLARAIRHRDSPDYGGSWDKLIEDFAKKRKERPLYRCVRKQAAEEEKEKLLKFKSIESEYGINLADFCLAL